MGNQFHDVMELLYKDLKCKIYSLEELLELYDKSWDKEFDENVLVVRKDRTVDDYKNIGKRCIEDYYRRYHPFDQARVLGVERQVMVDLKGDGKYKVQGYIDRLVQDEDGTYEIHDYKTAGHLPEQKKLDEDRQLALYQIGIGDMWNDVSEVKLIWHYVVFDKEMVSTRTQDELESLRKDTIDLIDKIESTEKYEPCESNLCNWCSYKDLCPLFMHDYKKEAKEEKAIDIAKVVDEYGKLKDQDRDISARAKALQEEIRKYLDKESVERVFGDHYEVTRSKGSQERLDTAKAKKLLEQNGLLDDVIYCKETETIRYKERKEVEE